MTEQQRQGIRAELARRMGWTQRHTTDIVAGKLAGDWIKPDGSFHDREGWPPDPFTDAADNRALVEWLAAQDEDTQELYQQHLVRKLSWGDSDNRGALVEVLVFQTAPYEAITLAAAKALGIQEAGE